MDRLILDFEGEMVEIPSGFNKERVVSQIGMKIEHAGKMWTVVDRVVQGVDEVAAEYASIATDCTNGMTNKLTLVVLLQRVR